MTDTIIDVVVDDEIAVDVLIETFDVQTPAPVVDVVTVEAKGDKGDPGTDGAPGESAYQVSVDAGFSGTLSDWLLSLKGDKGDRGETGLQGIQGTQGEPGVRGLQGTQGEAGVSLDIEGTVATYTDLPAEPSPGDAYVVAADGKLYFFDGNAWPANGQGVPFRGPDGEQGIQGIQGIDGTQGIQGIAGDKGDPGESAYQVAVDGGFSGSETDWLASLKGDEGTTGDPGPSYEPPFVLLTPTGTTGFGNGLDGRTPAVSCAAGALGGGYMAGWSGPWPSVDVYVAWLEYSGAAAPWVCSVYLKTMADGGSGAGKPLLANQISIMTAGTQFGYHETLVASGVPFTPDVMATGTVARYGNQAADTYAQAIGVVGIILRPAA